MTKPKPTVKVKFLPDMDDDKREAVVRDVRAQAWHDLFNQLKEKPGTWAVIKEFDDERCAYSAFNRLRKHRHNLMPNGVWQLRSRQRMENGIIDGSTLLGRFVAECDTPELMRGQRGRIASSAIDNDKDAVPLI